MLSRWEACLAHVLKARPDVLLLDVDMPGKDGFEICQQLRNNALTRDILIVFLTGADSAHDKLRGLEAGAVDYITKPFDPAELKARVRAALRTKELLELLQHKTLVAQRNEELFRVLAENSADMISRHAADGTYLYVSPAVKTILGYDPDDLLGRNILEHVHDDDVARCGASFPPSAHASESQVLSFRLRRRDGNYVQVESALRALRDPETTSVRELQASTRDQTPRLQAEEIARERSSLRGAVASMEQVLGVVAHELRTPLAGLRVISELILSMPAEMAAERDQYTRQIHQEVVQMAETVNTLLEAARLNSGRAKWNFGRLNVADVCTKAVDFVRPLVDDANVALAVRVDPELSMAGDAGAIRRLVLNLVSNSRKFTSAGHIEVEAVARETHGTRWIEIRVDDTGCGMATHVIRRLGQPFALNSGIVGESHVGGTGLGIAICNAIATAHGGTIRAESQLGVGTTVIVSLRADLAAPQCESDVIVRAA